MGSNALVLGGGVAGCEYASIFGALGVQPLNTCAPYQVGNVPSKGEHCAWMESSAVIYCNAVLGGRTNAEGRESAGALNKFFLVHRHLLCLPRARGIS